MGISLASMSEENYILKVQRYVLEVKKNQPLNMVSVGPQNGQMHWILR